MIVTRTRALLPTLAAAVALCAGCTETGTPVPTTAPATTSGNAKTPRVNAPIDPGEFLTNPCALLTPAQAARLGLEGEGLPENGSAEGNRRCSWQDDRRADHTINWLSSNKGGIADTYRDHDRNPRYHAYWEPKTIEGYPAVFTDISDGRDRGYCTVVVGVRDELAFLVGISGGAGRASCAKVEDIAREAIATLKAGG